MSSPKRRPTTTSRHAVWRWSALAVIVIGAVALTLWRPGGNGSGGNGDPSAASTSASGAMKRLTQRSPLAARYARGDVLRYALKYESAIDANDGGRFFQLGMSGQLELRVVEVGPFETLLAVAVRAAHITSQNARAQQADAYREAEAALTRPAFLTLDGHGAVTGMRVAGSAPHSVVDLTRAIAALSQYVVPDAPTSSWTASEADASGRYDAEYRSLESARHTAKRKLAYTQIPAQPGLDGDLRVDVLSSDGDFVVDGAGRTVRMRVREAIQTLAQLLPAMKSTTSLALELKSIERDPSAVAALRAQANELSPVALHDPISSDHDEADLDRRKVAGRTYGDFTREFATLPTNIEQESPEQRDHRRRLFIEFAALLRSDDGAVDQVMEQILSDELDDPSMLWDALASAGSPKAQAALRQLFADPRFDQSEHRMQLIGLSFVQKPTKETVDYLASTVGDADHGQQARFGLGTAANRLAAKDPLLAEQAVSTLVQLLDGAQTEGDRCDYLLALGNTGAPQARPLVLAALEDESTQVRAAAATALRYMQGDEIDAALLTLMTKEAEPSVRLNAHAAARNRPPTAALLDAVYEASEHDDDREVRREAGATLGEWQRQVPEIGTALAEFKQPNAAE